VLFSAGEGAGYAETGVKSGEDKDRVLLFVPAFNESTEILVEGCTVEPAFDESTAILVEGCTGTVEAADELPVCSCVCGESWQLPTTSVCSCEESWELPVCSCGESWEVSCGESWELTKTWGVSSLKRGTVATDVSDCDSAGAEDKLKLEDGVGPGLFDWDIISLAMRERRAV
jgi:hypothetical protein